MSYWGTISFICDLSTGLAVISALSSSGGDENAHMFPFSLSYLTCLQGLADYKSDATKTGVEGRGGVRKAEKDATLQLQRKSVSACYLF